MKNEDVIAVLNDLIETCKDGESGFKACAEDISNGQFKQPFLTLAAGCAAAERELQGLVVAHGGIPESKGSIGAVLHRRWIDIKSVILGKDDEAILDECERGEDVAVKAYRTALEKPLPLDVKAVVERQFQGVLQNHDVIRKLRDRSRVTSL